MYAKSVFASIDASDMWQFLTIFAFIFATTMFLLRRKAQSQDRD